MFSTNSEIVLTFETVNIVSPQLSDIKINKVGWIVLLLGVALKKRAYLNITLVLYHYLINI